jgi:hypothetical protein
MVTGSNPITILSLAALPASPARYGTPVTWTAAAYDELGTATLEYQFWRYSYKTSAWSIVRNYSTLPSYSWTPGAGDVGQYVIHVRVRSAGKVAFEAYQDSTVFTVSDAPPVSITSLVRSTPLPAMHGTPVSWTAAAAGGVGPLQYEFWRYCIASPTWVLERGYSADPTFSWTPAAADAGMCYARVRVRSNGSTLAYEAARDSSGVMVTGPNPIAVSSLIDDSGGEGMADFPIAWTATATGGTGPLEYQFWRYSYVLGTWAMVRDYAQDPTYTWTPNVGELGQHVVHVRVRSAGKLAFEAYREAKVMVY